MMRSSFVAINAHYMHTSLALRQIRACFPESEYFEFHINQPFERILGELIDDAPDAIGFSCYIWNVDIALKLCRALKVALPGIKIALGGPEVEYDAEAYLRAHPEIDYVLCGEGEIVWPGFITALNAGDGGSAAGVCARNEHGEFVPCTPARLTAPEEWRYPYPKGLAGLENRLLYIETSRGCPFKCAYCLSQLTNVRMLETTRAIEFLTRMADDGARIIKLVDRTFNLGGNRTVDIWNALIDRADSWPQKPVFHFEITARLLDEEALACLERAPKGLFQLEIGIQSTSERVLGAVSRQDDYHRIAYVVNRLRRAGNMHLHVDLIAGLPGETPESFARAFDAAYDMGAHRLQLGFLKLLRGSSLRRDARTLGLRYCPDAPYEILFTDDMPPRALLRLKQIESLLEAYCNSGRYECTMRLLTHGRSAYGLLDGLRAHYVNAGLFNRGLSEGDRVSALYDFGRKWPGAHEEWLRACLIHDCMARGGRLDLPEDLRAPMSETDKAALREYVTPVRGQWITHYAVDIVAFARGDAAARRECAVLYDPKKNVWFEREV